MCVRQEADRALYHRTIKAISIPWVAARPQAPGRARRCCRDAWGTLVLASGHAGAKSLVKIRLLLGVCPSLSQRGVLQIRCEVSAGLVLLPAIVPRGGTAPQKAIHPSVPKAATLTASPTTSGNVMRKGNVHIFNASNMGNVLLIPVATPSRSHSSI